MARKIIEDDLDTSKEDVEVSKESKNVSEKKPDQKEEVSEQLEEIREVIVEKKTGFNYLEVILIMIITLIIGGFFGGTVVKLTDKKTGGTKEVTTNGQYQEFIDTYNDIKKNYYEKIDEDALLDAGIKGMLEFLGDKYSVYMDQEETDEFNEQVEGKYEGVGVEIVQDENGAVSIYRVFENSPAEKAGLKAGDIIQKVGSEDVTKKTTAEISEMIKKSKEKKVQITILRNQEAKEFTLERESIDIESVAIKTFEVNKKKIGYIAISVFASNTEEQFTKKLKELEKEKIDGLVIDVRGNSGGYLNKVTDIASMFLEKGKVIYQLDTKGIVEQIRDESKEKRNYKIAVLINKGSASASEILAAALNESYGASLVGSASYGKGTVQRAYTLESGATVKYTIQKWLTPKGTWINEKGLTPTHPVDLDVKYLMDPKDENDNQLQTALEEVSK